MTVHSLSVSGSKLIILESDHKALWKYGIKNDSNFFIPTAPSQDSCSQTTLSIL